MREVRKGAAINMSGRNQIAQRMHIAADGEVIGSPAATARCARSAAKRMVWRSWRARAGIGQLRSLSGDRAQLERSFAAQQDTDQARAQQQAEAVGQGFDHGGNVGRSVQGLGHVRQDFGAAVLLARGLAQPGGLQQAAQLAGQNRGFGRQIFVEKVRRRNRAGTSPRRSLR